MADEKVRQVLSVLGRDFAAFQHILRPGQQAHGFGRADERLRGVIGVFLARFVRVVGNHYVAAFKMLFMALRPFAQLGGLCDGV